MTIDVKINDGSGVNGSATVIKQKDAPSGLVTYTQPYKQLRGQTKPMLNPINGINFAVNSAFSGTPVGVHDGTDSAEWTASALSGSWTFDSTAQAQAGEKSVDATATTNEDEAQFEGDSPIATGSYAAFTGYIFLTSWSSNGTKDITVRNRLAGVDAGSPVNLSNYINTGVLNVWQLFVIPLADFAMPSQNIDQVVFKTIDVGAGSPPNYYLDEMNFQETGGNTWTVEADKQSIYSMTGFSITMADAYDSTLTNATHQKIPYNTLLAVSALNNGINFRLTTDEVVRFNGIFNQHLDFMTFPGTTVQSGGDGTNTWITYHVTFDPPAILDSRTGDKFEMTISDNLSGLLYGRVLVRGSKEEVELA